MEEKKMTDEEIVNALDKTKQELANINPEDDDYDKLLAVKKIVDYCHYLIRRLQSENEQLRNAKTIYESVDYCADDLAKALKTIDEQKAEIERLKEKFSISHYRDSWKNKFFKAQEEVERLTEENTELQKQVDKAWFEVGKMCMEERKDTAEKFAERLKKEAYGDDGVYYLTNTDIDEIAKEIMEGK